MGLYLGSSGEYTQLLLGASGLEPEEVQGRTGRFHGPAFASWWVRGLEAVGVGCMIWRGYKR